MKSLMQNFSLKSWCRHALVACAAMVTLAFVACSYDDSDLWKSVNGLEDRVKTLEDQVDTLNTHYEKLTLLVKAMEENISIVSVEEVDTTGYKITFSNKTSIILTNGKNGEKGEQGKPGKNGTDAPVLGIGLDATDGVYYWTLTSDENGVAKTTWLLDVNGNKMPVSGVTPLLGVDANGYWTVSYDRGATYSLLLDSAGNPIEAKADSTLLKSITCDEQYVYITLNDADNTVLKLLRDVSFSLVIEDAPAINGFNYGETRTFKVKSTGVTKVVITKPNEWKASLVDGILSVTAPTVGHAACAEMAGEVAVIYFADNGMSRVATLDVAIMNNQQVSTCYSVAIPVDFSGSKVQQVLVNNVKVAEICREFIRTSDGSTMRQMTVVYPVKNGIADLSKGIDVATGGSVVWNVSGNSVTCTAGEAALTCLYVDAEGSLMTVAPENVLVEAAIVKNEMLRDVRGIEVQEYPLVKIGTQYWIAENLRARRYNDGSIIAIAADWDNVNGAFTFLNDDASNADIYGLLYSGRTVFSGKLAPEGWNVCSADDITKLKNYIGATDAGALMKSVAGWTRYPGNDMSGFNALPGMYYEPGDNVDNWGGETSQVTYWTATEIDDPLNPKSACFYSLSDNNNQLTFNPSLTIHSLDFGHYVRCIRK